MGCSCDGVSKPGQKRPRKILDEKQTPTVGWRAGGINRIHRTILLYSFEPPTALMSNAVFLLGRGG